MANLDTGGIQIWEVMITTLAAAVTPYVAYKFRERRAKRPKSPTEALYQYYENYIDRLEDALEKKDLIIAAQDKQIREQDGIIDGLQHQLKAQREQLQSFLDQINILKGEVGDMKGKSKEAHTHIEELKSKANGDIK